MKNNSYAKIEKNIFIFCLIFGLIIPVSAEINISVESGTNYIKWTWEDTTVNRAYMNGLNVTESINENTYVYNTPYPAIGTIIIYSSEDSGTNTSRTLPVEQSKTENVFSFIDQYIWLIFAIIVIIASVRVPLLGVVAAILCAKGIQIGLIDNSFLVFLLYVITLAISLLIMYARSQ